MAWLRRMAFFIGLNIVVMITISLVINLLGIQPYLTARGMNYGSLIAFCLVWGMGGAFISLMLSRIIAKWSMGVKVIDPATRDPQARALLDMVHRLSRSAGLTTMPQVGIYPSQEVNAFATGPSRNRSLVAVSDGLLRAMDDRSMEGVLGHEIAHVANGDMVTMTLIQGVVNAFVMAMARIVAFAIDNFLRGDRDKGGLGHLGYYLVVMLLELVFFIPGSFVVAWFSRTREYRADQGGARYAGRDNMIGALRTLQRMSALNAEVATRENSQGAAAVASLKISSNRRGGLLMLMSTHPPLEDRIARLERGL